MRTNLPLTLLLVAIMITLLAVLGYEFLPEKQHTIVPGEQGAELYNPYSDSLEGGPSYSEVEQVDEGILWRCRIEEQGDYAYCGINLMFSEDGRTGLDLSGYHSIRLMLVRPENGRVINAFIRHYDEKYSNPDDGNSAQFSHFAIHPTDMEEQPLLVGFEEFSLADWWISTRELPRELRRPAFTNVVLVGLDYREALTPGSYELQILRVAFVGDWVSRERWYLGILLIWLAAASAWIVVRMVAMSRSARRHRAHLSALSQRNQQLSQESSRYKNLSIRDPLTGAFNRLGFEQRWGELAVNPAKWPLSIVLLDIDHFKRFNDTYGHGLGDEVLCKVVEVLDQSTRKRDLLCRWGGEEFLLLCPETGLEEAALLAEKIRLVVADTDLGAGIDARLTLSLSVCEVRADESFADAFVRADGALYEAKERGRNQVLRAAPHEPV